MKNTKACGDEFAFGPVKENMEKNGFLNVSYKRTPCLWK